VPKSPSPKRLIPFPPHELVIRATIRDDDPPEPPQPTPIKLRPTKERRQP
jgi:hypothetical protein